MQNPGGKQLIDKRTILSELEARGEPELVKQAEQRLPDQVHVGNHAVQLRDLGLDPESLAAKYLPNPRP